MWFMCACSSRNKADCIISVLTIPMIHEYHGECTFCMCWHRCLYRLQQTYTSAATSNTANTISIVALNRTGPRPRKQDFATSAMRPMKSSSM